MSIGAHSQKKSDEIIEILNKEGEENRGITYYGYGNNICSPEKVIELAKQNKQKGERTYLLLFKPPSPTDPKKDKKRIRPNQIYVDGEWIDTPEKIKEGVINCEYAITCTKFDILDPKSLSINKCDYYVERATGKKEKECLGTFSKNRFDKACARKKDADVKYKHGYTEKAHNSNHNGKNFSDCNREERSCNEILDISYRAEIVEPYAVKTNYKQSK